MPQPFQCESLEQTQSAHKSKGRKKNNWTPKRTIARTRLPPLHSWAKVSDALWIKWDDKETKCKIKKMDDEN
eukprot:SAG22_NODE_14267_length_379_cov_4.264286_1_plen_71_part_01